MQRTIEEINAKIRSGKAVVVDAEEVIDLVADKGVEQAAREVDVVTTGTFGPMCSSGALLNTGHTNQRCKYAKATLNGVPAYAGMAAVDVYVGATEMREDDPGNRVFPGRFEYGGAHVIEDLVAGKDIVFHATSEGSDCYPRREVRTLVKLDDLNQAVLLNPRNAYQNYNVAVNRDADRVIYTYMGVLQPNMANANYCSAGQLSPLLNDPLYRTIGVGTRIFLGGGIGHVWWEGTQHAPGVGRTEGGVPKGGSGTLAVCGDLKTMDTRWLRGASISGYGVSLAVGIGIPIPILDEDAMRYCSVSDADIVAPVVDYSNDYPGCVNAPIAHVSYKELKTGCISVNGKDIPTAGLSSYSKGKEIATILKEWILKGDFELTQPIMPLAGPETGQTCKPFIMRPVPEDTCSGRR
jgi:L-aspartate semialdehyde sulfurtransferase